MKVVFYVLECLDYEYLRYCNTPNIDSLNPHPALSFGATTAAAVPALLTGYTPTCIVDRKCPHNTIPRKLIRRTPFFLKEHFKNNVYLYIPNGWTWQFLKPYLTPLMPKLKKWHYKFNTKEMIEDFLERKKPETYFAYFHVMETHPPFLDGTRTDIKPGSPEWWQRRRKAVELADKYLEPLLEMDDLDLLVVCADHNIAHDISTCKGLEVFIAIKSKMDY